MLSVYFVLFFSHCSDLFTASLLSKNNSKLPIESGTPETPHFIIEPRVPGFDPLGRKTLTFSISAWTNSTEASFDIASKLCDSLNRRSLINDSGWIERIEVTTGVETLPYLGQERISGASFDAIATLKV